MGIVVKPLAYLRLLLIILHMLPLTLPMLTSFFEQRSVLSGLPDALVEDLFNDSDVKLRIICLSGILLLMLELLTALMFTGDTEPRQSMCSICFHTAGVILAVCTSDDWSNFQLFSILLFTIIPPFIGECATLCSSCRRHGLSCFYQQMSAV